MRRSPLDGIRLLSEDGSVRLHLDDTQMHPARCVLDEVFGASNFVANVRDAFVPPSQRRVLGAMALVKVIGHLAAPGGEFGG